ncbi:TrlF family AAA-like ATPase [Aurantimonas endophytica]|uniref:ABC-type cobalamin/Fe3+-siderophores transport system ATPase subunit n=1 Tax=Aurantimonas endophytica TaxID=1522175 RepID=A0A7W6H9T7_9HYPH|nr:AAA family ATPase [Aurantimonas endophytica]MBB4001270.1 ABC-type cobalamin/Fe3+-siderophores transport system ATPase subunit [Aurantimonas endophytica]MCO6403086.1 AAA family ATPase [Aurantimonas endophytica]
MTETVGCHPGAVWMRIDVQCHSPRDYGWSGSPDLPGGTPELEEARRNWATDFVSAARGKGLALVALTDHHDMAMVPHVVSAAAALDARDSLIVLPGVEVTCQDSVQCLVLFEPTSSKDVWDRMLHHLPGIARHDDHAAKGPRANDCGLTLQDLIEKIANEPILNSATLLLPHFSRPDAHKSLNREGFSARAKDIPVDGIYIECPRSELDSVTVDKIEGRLVDWGNRRRAILATGDNKRATWDRLGHHECWIKLGENSLEGFRQAFLADEARITHSAPQVPTDRVVEMEVQSTLTGSAPVRLTFNDGFTALIGGRGSGKSSMLEYLRFGLGKSEGDISSADSNTKKRRDREAKLIEDTLVHGWVRVVLERGGVTETWCRKGERPEEIQVTYADGTEDRITVAAAQLHFPARAFHQKELSTTMLDPQSAADNITGIAAAEVIEDRRRIEREIVNAKRVLTTDLQGVAGHWQAELELAQARSVVEDIKRRLEVSRIKLQDGGVQQGDIDVLAAAPRYGRARNFLEEIGRSVAEDRKTVEETLSLVLHVDSSRYADAFEFDELEALRGSVIGAKSKIAEAARSALGALDDLLKVRQSVSLAYEQREAEFKARYDESKQRQIEHGSLIAESERLAAQLKDAEASGGRASDNEQKTRPAVERLALSRNRLLELLDERQQLLARTADEVRDKSGGMLKARVKRDRKPSDRVTSLMSLFEGSRLRDAEQFCSERVAQIHNERTEGDWAEFTEKWIDIYRSKVKAGSPAEPGPEVIEAIREAVGGDRTSTLTAQQATKVYANLTDQSIGLLLSSTPQDRIILTYVSEGTDIPFEQASAGQQASALLRLLLNQEAGSLIIDQPEDDLDNRVVMDIVRLIRTSKSRRQLIFATHNPNLVVNGDADKIVMMVASVAEDRPREDAPRVRIGVDGAIETPKVRDEITRVMEGGADAFDLRARKYRVSGIPVA